MRLNAAKQYALEIVRGIRPGRVLVDPIGNLRQEALKASAPDEPTRTWPIDVMGGRQRGLVYADLRRAILDTERVLEQTASLPSLRGDDYELTYDENGYPEMPACLDRRLSRRRGSVASHHPRRRLGDLVLMEPAAQVRCGRSVLAD
jgi:hypothetical protein